MRHVICRNCVEIQWAEVRECPNCGREMETMNEQDPFVNPNPVDEHLHCWHQYKIGIGVQVDPIPSRCCECDAVTEEDLWKSMNYTFTPPKALLNQEYTDAGA